MWCELGKSITIATVCLVTASTVLYDTADAVRQRNYTQQEFRSVLRGLGYKVKVSSEPLTNTEAKRAIQELQTGYKLKPADGVAGPKTQDYVASIVRILQSNLNVVLKPATPLPRNQFYSTRTEAAVKEFQKKLQLEETGIADLALRQRLDQEARTILDTNPAATPTTKPTRRPTRTRPRPTPTQTPVPEATSTPEATPTETPTPEVTSTPEATSTPDVTPTPDVTTTPTPTSSPTRKPSSTTPKK